MSGSQDRFRPSTENSHSLQNRPATDIGRSRHFPGKIRPFSIDSGAMSNFTPVDERFSGLIAELMRFGGEWRQRCLREHEMFHGVGGRSPMARALDSMPEQIQALFRERHERELARMREGQRTQDMIRWFARSECPMPLRDEER